MVGTGESGVRKNNANLQGRDCLPRIREAKLCRWPPRNDRYRRGAEDSAVPGAEGRGNRAKQSQFPGGTRDAKCRLTKGLGGKCMEGAAGKTKPIWPAGPVVTCGRILVYWSAAAAGDVRGRASGRGRVVLDEREGR